MTSPLLAIGGAALGTLAVKTARELKPGEFFRQLWQGTEPADTSDSQGANDSSARQTMTLDLSQAVPAFVEQLQTRLHKSGVTLTEPVMLKDDGRGGVIVDGDHPDRVAIEAIFASDSRLQSEFQAINHAATQQRDHRQPQFGPSLGEFRLSLDAKSATVVFE